ncbi:serine protease [SAR86 cluster bacterium]|nr:serine protease [SAR86 cluster bacterium]
MKFFLTLLFVLLAVSCATPQQLINQNVIYKGMDKNSLWSAMIDVNISDDITLGGCYRQYFQDSKYELLSSSSQSTWYIFKDVTVPAALSNCSYRGNGKLDEVFYSYSGAINYVQEEVSKNQVSQNETRENTPRENDNSNEDILRAIGNGSGFFINDDGYLVSNYHVIEICQAVGVPLDGEILPLKILASDIVNDLIVGRVDLTDKNSFLYINTEGAYLGDDVMAAGFPLDQDLSENIKVTRGIVSSMSGMGNNYSQYQIDAAVQGGNSGGPLLDDSGKVVGVVVSQIDKVKYLAENDYIPENVNFAVKSQNLEVFLTANSVKFLRNNSTRTFNNREIAQSAENATVKLICYNTISNLREMIGDRGVNNIFPNIKK